MPDTLHLLVPYAACSSPGGQQALQGLALPHLDRLLSRLTPLPSDVGSDENLSSPHERALARALGVWAAEGVDSENGPPRGQFLPHSQVHSPAMDPEDGKKWTAAAHLQPTLLLPPRLLGLGSADGRIPWAAWHARQHGLTTAENAASTGWAFVTPCHWQVRTDHVTLDDPAQLQLTEDDSRTLLAIMAPWFAGDGITLAYDEPTRWLAQGDMLADLPTASLERVLHRDVAHWLPGAQKSHPLRRLHSEMQMLLYTHPFNDAREARGLAPVNAFWVHGAGALPQASAPTAPTPEVDCALRAAALREDWSAWRHAWQQLDAGALARLQAHVARGGAAQLTLCGERSALAWHTAPRTLGQRIQGLLRPRCFADVREQL